MNNLTEEMKKETMDRMARAIKCIEKEGTVEVTETPDQVIVKGPYNKSFIKSAKKDGAQWNGREWIFKCEDEIDRACAWITAAFYYTEEY